MYGGAGKRQAVQDTPVTGPRRGRFASRGNGGADGRKISDCAAVHQIKGPVGAEKPRGLFITRENLRWLAKDSEAGGQISPIENLMIGRVLSLQLKTAAEVMTPIAQVRTLRPDATLGDAADLARSSHHMKFPVMTPDGARCVGVLNVRDVLAHITDKPNDKALPHVRAPFYVKADVRADDVLPLLRRARRRMAVVRDKSGRILGILTVAGILRFVVGKLPDQ